MIISPPFLPADGLTSSDPSRTDPMMDVVDKYELSHHGVYPIAFDRRWHCGAHLVPTMQTEPVRAIADGKVIAYLVSQKPVTDGQRNSDGSDDLNSTTGFVLLKHTTETGEGRSITFYSLYMHLLDLDGIRTKVGPLPNNLPDVGSSTVLPKWLENPTNGVKVPQNLKVYRKDILGYYGACHGQPHLHFEIFMTEADFTAWFEQPGHAIQLGNENPTTPASKDYWGNSYFVIPGGQTFVSAPPGQVGAAATYFPALQAGTLDADSKLYVEAYFHRGQRYTRSWVEKDGTVTLLTPSAIRDAYANYEYEMFARATALYPQCPSDGYEMLRFGRILRDSPKLSAADQKTWVSVTFETGKQGYIDISQNAIQKLSDADFPFHTGWQKIDEGNTPFSEDGMCDYDELRKIVAVVEEAETPDERMGPGYAQEGKLAAYIETHAEVRQKLRGFVCHAPSEWDASGNEARYQRLNDPDGFFGKRKDIDPEGYTKFIEFLQKFQFLDKTPLGTDKRFWFFHPLAFVRHFRRCGWLSRVELAQLLPSYTADKSNGNWNWNPVSIVGADPVLSNTSSAFQRRIELNKAFRKYGITSLVRTACFMGNATQETQWFQKFSENSPFWYKPWDGRGFLQLTHASNYIRYWDFSGIDTALQAKSVLEQRTIQANNNRPVVNGKKTMYDPTNSLSDASTQISALIVNRRNKTTDPFEAADSAGAYWAWSGAARGADDYYQTPGSTMRSLSTAQGNRYFYENLAFGKVAGTVNTGFPSSSYSSIWGIQARFLAFANAQVVLFDLTSFKLADGSQSLLPEGYVRREAW
ncbi:hypothetical protein A9975_36945 [Cupriavidus sp. UME77]|nr:hypothetical protein [Cupriavidus sp. UME77]